MSDLKQLVLATMIYSGDYDDRLPPRMSSGTVVGPYLAEYLRIGESQTLDSFTHSRSPRGLPWKGNFHLGGVKTETVKDLDATLMFFDAEAWPDGKRLAGFVDGHVRSLPGEQVEDAMRRNNYIVRLVGR